MKQYGLDVDGRMVVYRPSPWAGYQVARTSSDPAAVARDMVRTIREIDPTITVFDVQTMPERMSASLARQRFATMMLGAFAAFALILAIVGVYGVMSHLVTQGAHDIGVRMALGAERRRILLMVLRQGVELTVAGSILGLIGAVALDARDGQPAVRREHDRPDDVHGRSRDPHRDGDDRQLHPGAPRDPRRSRRGAAGRIGETGVAGHIGIVAVSAEGAALCYRTICAESAPVFGRQTHPEISMHTYSLSDYMRHIEADRWQEVGSMLLSSAEKLRQVGADFVICPDNTVHQGLDLVREASPLPWLHIAEEVASVAARRGFRRLLVLGTKYLMEGPVYPGKLQSRGIDSDIPPADRRAQIDAFIFNELVCGEFKDSTRSVFQEIIAEGKRRGNDAAVLGCTEIPLLIDDRDSSLPTLDSTRILARAAISEAQR